MRLFIERSWEIISHESFFMFSAILIEGILNKKLWSELLAKILHKVGLAICLLTFDDKAGSENTQKMLI